MAASKAQGLHAVQGGHTAVGHFQPRVAHRPARCRHDVSIGQKKGVEAGAVDSPTEDIMRRKPTCLLPERDREA